MRSDAVSGDGARRGNGRRGLMLVAFLLLVAQVLLFAVLRARKEDPVDQPARPEAGAATPVSREVKVLAPTIDPARLPAAAVTPTAAPTATEPAARPTPPPPGGDAPSAAALGREPRGADQAEERAERREREKRERADRERERRERAQAERDAREARERAKLEAERDRARLEAEKERARVETERAQKARAEAERERAQLEAERARLDSERTRRAAAEAPAREEPAPTGNPEVLVVVVSAGVGGGRLTREAIRNVYFGKTTFWPNDTPVRMYNRPAGSPAGRKFFRSVLGTSAGAFREHWNQLQLSGGGIAPSVISSAESVLARVAGSQGAVGYVLESELPAEVSGVRLIRFK